MNIALFFPFWLLIVGHLVSFVVERFHCGKAGEDITNGNFGLQFFASHQWIAQRHVATVSVYYDVV